MNENEELNQMEKISNIDNPMDDLLPAFPVPKSNVYESYKEAIDDWKAYLEQRYKQKLGKQKRKVNKLRKKTQALRHYRKKLIKLNKRKAS